MFCSSLDPLPNKQTSAFKITPVSLCWEHFSKEHLQDTKIGFGIDWLDQLSQPFRQETLQYIEQQMLQRTKHAIKSKHVPAKSRYFWHQLGKSSRGIQSRGAQPTQKVYLATRSYAEIKTARHEGVTPIVDQSLYHWSIPACTHRKTTKADEWCILAAAVHNALAYIRPKKKILVMMQLFINVTSAHCFLLCAVIISL